MFAKQAVSCALGPTEITRPLATELLRTCDFINQINKHNVQVVPYITYLILLTCAARSTLILE